jgi:Ca2+-binding RTX toxin-like protein
MIENLESRRLLSATLSAGVLTVEGSAKSDFIHVGPGGGKLNVQVNKERKSFALGDVKKLVVRGLNGNDAITFGFGTIGATVEGGNGNDKIIGTNNADTISAGAGNDYVHAWLGNDQVSGGVGNDTIIGCVGNDTIHGDAGNDLISGAKGDDVIFGDAGNDQLFGAAGNDKVDGGDGKDSAGKEGNDTFAKIEKIWR